MGSRDRESDRGQGERTKPKKQRVDAKEGAGLRAWKGWRWGRRRRGRGMQETNTSDERRLWATTERMYSLHCASAERVQGHGTCARPEQRQGTRAGQEMQEMGFFDSPRINGVVDPVSWFILYSQVSVLRTTRGLCQRVKMNRWKIRDFMTILGNGFRVESETNEGGCERRSCFSFLPPWPNERHESRDLAAADKARAAEAATTTARRRRRRK